MWQVCSHRGPSAAKRIALRVHPWLIAALTIVSAPPAHAQAPAFLVKDINTQRVIAGSYPRNFFSIDATTFFTAGDFAGARALWKTDGSAAGTERLSPPDVSDYFADVDGVLFFAAYDADGLALWKSDGTPAGTVRIRGISPLPDPYEIPSDIAHASFVGVGSRLVFLARDDDAGYAWWGSDGTPEGTVRLVRTHPGNLTGTNSRRVVGTVNGRACFSADDGSTGAEPWATDGTIDGTVRLADVNPGPGSSDLMVLGTLGTLLVFAASDGIEESLWATDGTPGGTRSVSRAIREVSSPAVVGNTLYFAGVDPSVRPARGQLFRTDGTPAGTSLVKDVSPFGTFGTERRVYFFTEGPDKLWVSDGTGPGTVSLADINFDGNSPRALGAIGDVLFYMSHGELWRSDGTMDGTYTLPVKLDQSAFGVEPWDPHFVSGDESAFFISRDADNRTHVWRTDGTRDGTIDLAVLALLSGTTIGVGELHVQPPTGRLLFANTDAQTGAELWTSDGTPEGTHRLANLVTDENTSHSFPYLLASLNGALLFAADDGQAGRELWRSDGSEAGTVLVADVNPGGGSANPGPGTVMGGAFFFPADDGTHGTELWRTDATGAGTTLVADIRPGAAGSSPAELVELGGTLFFRAETARAGSELWKSDGTAAATSLVKDIAPGRASSTPSFLTPMNGLIFFTTLTQLWRSDGTEAGTELVKDFGAGIGMYPSGMAAVGGTLFIGGAYPLALWKSDGTTEGTIPVRLARDVPLLTGGFADALTVVGDLLFFGEWYGGESFPISQRLWRSDGTPDGTFVIDPFATPLGTFESTLVYGRFQDPRGLYRTNGTIAGTEPISHVVVSSDLADADSHLLFQGCARESCGLWESDGTAPGTRLLAAQSELPINIWAPFSRPIVPVGPLVFYTAYTPTTGLELWAVPRASLGRCGNGMVDAGETCDPGSETPTCDADCTPPSCGDGVVNHSAGEICDDGNTDDGDCCSSACSPAPAGTSCSNADVCDGAERCDGGGTCRPGTRLECDDGNSLTFDFCGVSDAQTGCMHSLSFCVGDCDGNLSVAIGELVTMVNAALAGGVPSTCPAADPTNDGRVGVNEIITAVVRALDGCSNAF